MQAPRETETLFDTVPRCECDDSWLTHQTSIPFCRCTASTGLAIQQDAGPP